MRRHVLPAVYFAALAVLWTYPLAWRVSTSMPGALGDNEQFLWNFWWMRQTLATGADFFHTPYLFAPLGADLTLHTHSALAAFTAATLFGSLPLVTAMNVTTLLSLTLNGFCAYVLAMRLTSDRGAALIGGTIFAMSPYIAGHLNGHYDLIMPWVIVLFAYTWDAALRGSRGAAVACGVVVGVTPYVSSYYLVYDVCLGLCLLALHLREWSVIRRPGAVRPTWLWRVIAVVMIVDVAALLVATIGGVVIRVGGVRISITDPFNPLEIMWLLGAVALWLRVRPALRSRPRAGLGSATPAVAIVSILFVVISSPLIRNGIRLIASGDYVSQRYLWRSAPVGIDLASVVMGNPFHGLWGAPVASAYARLGINAVESIAWTGVVPLLLAGFAVWRSVDRRAVRQWLAVALVFLAWALGSLVHVAGYNIAMIGPAVVLRFIPLVGNARMPGRAMVVVYFAIAMLAAIGFAAWRPRSSRSAWTAAIVIALVCADFAAAPFPLTAVECPAIYQTLRDRPEQGTLAELPLSIGDGFGAVTPITPWALACQAVHERPMLGGVISRLPARLVARYSADPLLRGWLRASGAPGLSPSDAPLPDAGVSAQRLAANGIRFVLLHRDAATAELRTHVEGTLPLMRVAEDGDRILYVVTR